MKAIVVFYSLEGNTRLYAEKIAEQLGADLLELLPKKEVPKSNFRKYFWGGKSVVLKEKPELINETVDITAYDLVVLGSPIWAGSYAAPMHTFLCDTKIAEKKVALFACHLGGGAKKCFANYKAALSGNDVIGEIDFLESKDKGTVENEKKAIEFAKKTYLILHKLAKKVNGLQEILIYGKIIGKIDVF